MSIGDTVTYTGDNLQWKGKPVVILNIESDMRGGGKFYVVKKIGAKQDFTWRVREHSLVEAVNAEG